MERWDTTDNFYIGNYIKKYKSNNLLKKLILYFGIITNLFLLGFYKYSNFFVVNVNNIFDLTLDQGNIILPLAISFFTFQQIAYLVDTYQEKVNEKSFLNYGLFVTFFPQLIAGPIVHHQEMLPQFNQITKNKILYEDFCIGITIFSIGLFKKVFIADQLSLPANSVFDLAENGKELNAIQAFVGCFSYSFQLYFDFSGYSDMAIGLARIFGIRLILNFNSPYRAENISDFWNRWHISLSQFLRDYLYIPLGGNRKGSARRYINLMIVMLIGGLWHGAGWNFVFWGGLHGFFLVSHQLWKKLWKIRINKWWSIIIARLITFILVAVAWVFFRASSFDEALIVLNGMLTLPEESYYSLGFIEFISACTFNGCGNTVILNYDFIIYTIFALVCIWIFPNTQELLYKINPAYDYTERTHTPSYFQKHVKISWDPNKYWAVTCAFISWISIIQLNQISEFLYFQF